MANEQSTGLAEKEAAKGEIQQLFEAVLTAPYADKSSKKTALKEKIRALSGTNIDLFIEYFKHADKLVKGQSRVTFADDEWLDWRGKTLAELDPALKQPTKKSDQPNIPRQIALAFFRLIFPIGTLFALPYNLYRLFARLGKKDQGAVVESVHVTAGLLQAMLAVFFIAAVVGTGPFAPLAALGLPALIGITLGLAIVLRGIGSAIATVFFINPSLKAAGGKQVEGILGNAIVYGLVEKSLPDFRSAMKKRATAKGAHAGSEIERAPMIQEQSTSSSSSTAHFLGQLDPPPPLIHKNPSVAAEYALNRRVQVNQGQLAQEQKANYLSYSKTRLNESKKTLHTLQAVVVEDSKNVTFADDKEALTAMLPAIEQLLARIEKVESLNKKVEKMDSVASKTVLNETRNVLKEIAESKSTNKGTEMDTALQKCEKELDDILRVSVDETPTMPPPPPRIPGMQK